MSDEKPAVEEHDHVCRTCGEYLVDGAFCKEMADRLATARVEAIEECYEACSRVEVDIPVAQLEGAKMLATACLDSISALAAKETAK